MGASAPSVEELSEQGRIWMIGRKPWCLDILTAIDGVAFEECWPDRVHADFVPSPLTVISLEALITNKRASGRAKELADVSRLEAMQPGAPRGQPERRGHPKQLTDKA